MGHYRRVDTRIWGDGKFRRLSALQPSGQALWFWLLFGKQTTSLPGLYSIGPAGAAESLKWPQKAFEKAFAEALELGMVEVDWDAPLIYLPNAVRHNPPQSINTVRHWVKHADDLPECPLKIKALRWILSYLEGMGQAWAYAFRDGLGDAIGDGIRDSDSDSDSDSGSEPGPEGMTQAKLAAAARLKDGSYRWTPERELAWSTFWDSYPGRRKTGKPQTRRKYSKIPTEELAGIQSGLEAWKESGDWKKSGGDFVPGPHKFLNQEYWRSPPPPGSGIPESLRGIAEALEEESRTREDPQGSDCLDCTPVPAGDAAEGEHPGDRE